MTNPPWVLAPREPDMHQKLAGERALAQSTIAITDFLRAGIAYRAMLATAPAVPIAPEALDRLAAFERQVSKTRGSFITALQCAYGIDGEFIDATDALTADLRALLKAVGR